MNGHVVQPWNYVSIGLPFEGRPGVLLVKSLINSIGYHYHHGKDVFNSLKVVIFVAGAMDYYMSIFRELHNITPLESYLKSNEIDKRDTLQQDYFITSESSFLDLIKSFDHCPWIKEELGRMPRWILFDDRFGHQLEQPWPQIKDKLFPRKTIQIIEIIPPESLVAFSFHSVVYSFRMYLMILVFPHTKYI